MAVLVCPLLGSARAPAFSASAAADLRCRVASTSQQARSMCTCICAATALQTSDSGMSRQHVGLSDHHGSGSSGSSGASTFRSDPTCGNCSAVGSSRAKSSSTVCLAAASIDEQVMAEHPNMKRTAWNKGRSMSEMTRQKISLAQKQRWKDPTLRATVGAKLAGKTPWNKGRKLSDETRARISAARLNKRHLRATKNKMSQSHMGKTHTPATAAALSAKLAGRSKDLSHREAIAAAQRRRHAACRVLSAIEEVHRASQQEVSHGGGGSGGVLDASRFRPAGGVESSSGLKGLKGKGATRGKILATYTNQLREYRNLKEELTPWTQAYEARNGRKPRLVDVERTGIEWLITKYKCYVMMRDRLMVDTPKLRTKISGAPPGMDMDALSSGDESSWAPQSSAAAAASSGSSLAVQRLTNVLEHKRSQDAAKEAAAAAAAASAASQSLPADGGTQQFRGRPIGGRGPVQLGSTRAGNGAAGRGQGSPRPLQPLGEAALQQQQPQPLRPPPLNAPARVKSAMAAALQYRQKKAAETAAAATAAAASAASPRRQPQPASQPPVKPPESP